MFRADPASATTALTANTLSSATSIATAVTAIENAVTADHGVAYGVYGGNTFIAEKLSAAGTAASNFTIVELANTTVTSLTPTAGFVTIGSVAATTASLGNVYTAITGNYTSSSAATQHVVLSGTTDKNVTLSASVGVGGIVDLTSGTTGTSTVDLTGSSGYTVYGTSNGGTTVTGDKSFTAYLGTGGSRTTADTVVLKTATTLPSDTVYGFGGGAGTVVDLLHVTTAGEVIGSALTDKTGTATGGAAIGAASGLVFTYADAGTALTTTTAAALFTTTGSTTGKWAISAGGATQTELLIETGANNGGTDYVYAISETSA